jgi:hypothetical protein
VEFVEDLGQAKVPRARLAKTIDGALEAARGNERLARQVEHATHALRRDANHPLASIGGLRGTVVDGLARGSRLGCDGGRSVHAGGDRRLFRHLGRDRTERARWGGRPCGEETGQRRRDVILARVFERLGGRLVARRQLPQEVHARELRVDHGAMNAQLPGASGDEDVLHGVRDLHASVEPDDLRRALDRVRSAHQRIERRAVIGGRFERQESRIEGGRVRVHLLTEQLEHAHVAEAVAHATHLASAANSVAPSIRPTTRSPS